METQSLIETFLRETDELLEDLEQRLLELESCPQHGELVNHLFRIAHTLKGNAGMVGFQEFVRLNHALENVLDCLRSNTLEVTQEVVQTFLEALDELRRLVDDFRAGKPCALSSAYETTVAALLAFAASAGAEVAPQGVRRFAVSMYFTSQAFQRNDEPAQLLEELALLGEVSAVELLFDRVPALDQLAPLECRLGLRLELLTDAGAMGISGFCCLSVDEADLSIVERENPPATPDFVSAVAEHKSGPEFTRGAGTTPKAARASANRSNSTVRVDTAKLDPLLDLVGELVIAISHVGDQSSRDPSARAVAQERLELLGRELQDRVMGLRMSSSQDTFERFRRPLRDLAKELQKQVNFEIEGGDTQVDRKVLEQLVDPLKHMLRNCVSHGLELPADRLALGKPEVGVVTVRATQREGQVVIEVSDDGRGIDAVRVRAKAEERGLVQPGQALTEAQIYDLLFLPGFSTASEVSEISGRGVGLDVVRRNIQALRGSVVIDSRPGHGTTFRIRLPLTLAIVDGMNVRVGPETVTIPLPSVVELIAPGPRSLQTMEGRHEYVDVRGELLPVLRLSEVLALPGEPENESDVRVVLVETERRKFGLLVNRVLGLAQTVIKPLDQGYELCRQQNAAYLRPRSIGGASILGDGNVGLILDVYGLETEAFGVA